MKIAENTVVSLRYKMKNDAGDLVDDIMDRKAVDYLHGYGNLLPALEANLVGLDCGERQFISISPETNPGLAESFHFEVIIDEIRAATEDEIRERRPLQITPGKDCGPGCCC